MSLSSRAAEGRIDVFTERGLVLTCHFGEAVRKPYLHPLCSPSGAVLTGDSPGDHPEHHGLFFGWADVDGVDFWHEPLAPRPGAEGGDLACGVITTEGGELEVVAEERSLSIKGRHRWRAPDGRILIEEERTLTVIEPEEEEWQLLDWRSDLQAVEGPVELGNRQKAMGLSFRAAGSLANGRRFNSRQVEGDATDGRPAEWCAYYGPGPSGASSSAGLAILAGRRNPHPRPEFHTLSEPYAFMSAAFAYSVPFVLPAGKTVSLNYRIALHDGPPDLVSLQVQYTAFMWG